jgi:hypothetical protein
MAYHPLRAAPNSGEMGTVYLFHFSKPFGHARHYRGWYRSKSRLKRDLTGSGSNLMARAASAGITFTLVSAEPGDRNRERQLKNRGGAARLCPVCRGEVMPDGPGGNAP